MNPHRRIIFGVIGIILGLIGCLVAYFIVLNWKEDFLVTDNQHATSTSDSITLGANANFELEFYIYDAGDYYAYVEMDYEIYIGGKLHSQGHIYYDSYDSDGYATLKHSIPLFIKTTAETVVTFKVKIIQGDYWAVKVYKNIPDEYYTGMNILKYGAIGLAVSFVIPIWYAIHLTKKQSYDSIENEPAKKVNVEPEILPETKPEEQSEQKVEEVIIEKTYPPTKSEQESDSISENPQMIKCTRCHTEFEDNVRFCPNCGSPAKKK